MDKRNIENGLYGLQGEIVRIDADLSTLERLAERKAKLSHARIALINKINNVEGYREAQIEDKATYEDKMLESVEKCGIDYMHSEIHWFEKTISALDKQLLSLRNQLDEINSSIISIDAKLSHKQRLLDKKAKVLDEIAKIEKELDEIIARSNSDENPTA